MLPQYKQRGPHPQRIYAASRHSNKRKRTEAICQNHSGGQWQSWDKIGNHDAKLIL